MIDESWSRRGNLSTSSTLANIDIVMALSLCKVLLGFMSLSDRRGPR